jgi:hypothetical protein
MLNREVEAKDRDIKSKGGEVQQLRLELQRYISEVIVLTGTGTSVGGSRYPTQSQQI